MFAPWFDHDALMHHTMHILNASEGLDKCRKDSENEIDELIRFKNQRRRDMPVREEIFKSTSTLSAVRLILLLKFYRRICDFP